MFGAIIGDIVGSRFEFDNYKGKDFELFTSKNEITDDSIMTIAIAKALMESEDDYSDLKEQAVYWMRTIGRAHPSSYGARFWKWLLSADPEPYNSWGNGSAMRISAVAYVAKTIGEVQVLSRLVTEVTHNHAEGLKGAEATAVAIFMALHGFDKEEIRALMEEYYFIGFTLDSIRKDYEYHISCQGTVPPAIVAFLEADSYEDAIRNAISIGGDSDTVAAITGSIAEAYYGVPKQLRETARKYLPVDLEKIVDDFEKIYPAKIVL